jgi:hypothetical protein
MQKRNYETCGQSGESVTEYAAQVLCAAFLVNCSMPRIPEHEGSVAYILGLLPPARCPGNTVSVCDEFSG